ncbi:MAG: hypothetical protein AABX01_07205 [Candidatus Micrarchaeota archaeon]
MANLKGSGGAIVFMAMAIIGISLIAYSFMGNDNPSAIKDPAPSPGYPTSTPTYNPTNRSTVTIATVAVGGDEPPPLPPE